MCGSVKWRRDLIRPRQIRSILLEHCDILAVITVDDRLGFPGVARMRSVLSLLFPVAVSAAALAALYNNVSSGFAILAILVLLNLGILLLSSGGRSRSAILKDARPSAICVLACLAAVAMLEVLFPRVMPLEYSKIKDLTKQFTDSKMQLEAEGTIMFTNEDQRRLGAAPSQSGSAPGLKRWHVPGADFAYFGYDPNSKLSYVNVFHWNSGGYYDHDYDLPRTDVVKRILVIGDSYVEAIQVPLTRSFHKLLEATLNSGTPDGDSMRHEVIALGSSGTGQVDHFKVLQNEAGRYNPDMVIITLCGNDFCDDDPDLKNELVLASGAVTPRIRRLASHGLYALAFAFRRLEDISRNRISVSPELLQWSRDDIPRVEDAWSRTLDKIRDSRNLCRERGVNFLLVYLGSDLEVRYALNPSDTLARLKAMGGPHQTMNWDLEKSVRRVASYCEDNDIPMLSLLEPLSAAQRETGHQVFGDHYTLFGHQVAAQVLRCALDSRVTRHSMDRVNLKQCLSLDSWGPVSPVAVVASPAAPTPATYVPATSRGGKSE